MLSRLIDSFDSDGVATSISGRELRSTLLVCLTCLESWRCAVSKKNGDDINDVYKLWDDETLHFMVLEEQGTDLHMACKANMFLARV